MTGSCVLVPDVALASRMTKLAHGIILTLSAEPLEDLRPGALRLLLTLRKLTGHSRRLATYTKSLATLLGRCTNTIRNWRAELIEKGYIHWITDQRTGIVTILLRDRVEPPSRRAKIAEQRRIDALPNPLPWQPPKPVILPPDPRPWWKAPLRTVLAWGGAQNPAPIKPSKKKELGNREILARKWGLLPD